MSEKRRGLGRGLGALIPSGAPTTRSAGERPVDVFFTERDEAPSAVATLPAQPETTDTATTDGDQAGVDAEVAALLRSVEDADEASIEAIPDAADDAATTDDAPGHDPMVQGSDEATPDAGSGNGDPEDSTPVDESDRDTAATVSAVATPLEEPVVWASAPEVDLVPVPGAYFAEVPVGSIAPNPRQPRQVFDEEDMSELVHSVREIGVLQPIVVRPIGLMDGEQRYELIMGERRWRATQAAGLETIPAIVRETGDDVLLRDALLENLHRSQLNALEEAAAYAQLLDDFGCTHDELAARIGRSRPQISNTIRLLKLPAQVQRRVAAGVLSAGHARAVLGLDDPEAMDRLAQRIVSEGLSVRAVEEIVALGDEPSRPRAKRPRAGMHRSELDDVASRLGDRLDTRVGITLGRSKGRLSIEFASVEDLNRIIALIAPQERGAFKTDQG